MVALERPSDISHLSINWQNPVNRNHGLNKDLVGWWLNVPHWQGGTVFRDLMGKHHGTLTGMDPATDWVQGGRPGGWGALDLDGTNDYINIPHNTEFDLQIFTLAISIFIPTGVDQPDNTTIIQKASDAANETLYSIQFRLGGTNVIVGQFLSGGTQKTAPVISLSTNTWHRVVFTYDQARLVLYVDGIERADNAVGAKVISATTFPVNIGRNKPAFGRVLEASIDDARILGRAWSSSEVVQDNELSQRGNPGLLNRIPKPPKVFALPSQSYLSVNWQDPIDENHTLNKGLVSWWLNTPHWQGGTVFRDLVSGNHGTLAGMDPATDWVAGGRPGGWGALDFDGINDQVEIPTPHAALDFTSAYTLEGWIRPANYDQFRLLFIRGDGDTDDIEIYIRSSDVIILHNRDNGGSLTFASPAARPIVAEWTHFVITYDTVNLWNMYYNAVVQGDMGVAFGSGEPPLDTNRTWRFGASEHSVFASNERWSGGLDAVRFYNRALLPLEVAQLYVLSLQGYPGLLNRIQLPLGLAASGASIASPPAPSGAGIRNPFGGPMVLRTPLGA